MKRCILLLVMLVCAWGIHAQNELSLGTASGHPGDTVTLVCSMTNTGNPVAMQAMIPLGSQLQYVAESCVLNASRANGHQLTTSVVRDTLRIYAYSFALQSFQGTSGELLSFRVVLGDEPGTYAMPITNSRLSTSSGTAISHTAQSGAVTILSPKISLGSSAIDFGHYPIRSTYTRSITVNNVGNEPLLIHRLTFDDTTLSCTDSNNTIAANGSKTYTIQYRPIEAGIVTRRCIIHSNAHVGDSVVSITANPYSVNELRVVSTSGYTDSTVRVYLRMNNMDSIVGLQTKIKLPTALTYVANSFRVESDRSQGHQAVAGLSHDTLNLVVFSTTNRPFRGGDGNVCSFEVSLSGYGSYSLTLKNTQLADSSAQNVMSSIYTGSINIYSPSLSAASSLSMGSSPVTDTAVVAYSVRNSGNAPLIISNVVFTNSDFSLQEALPITVANGTTVTLHVRYLGVIEGTCSSLMKLYSNDPNRTMYDVSVSATRYEPNSFSLESESELEDSVAYVDVEMGNYSDITAVQFDIRYPHHYFTVNSSEFHLGTRCSTHTMSAVRQNDSVFRVVIFSMTNTPISGNSGSLMTIELHPQDSIPQAAYRIVASRIILGNRLGNNQLSHADSVCVIGGIPVSVVLQVNNDTMGTASVLGRQMQERTVTLTATANYGYHFTKWSDGNRENPRSVLLTMDTAFVAEFEKNQYQFVFGSSDTIKGIVEELGYVQSVPYVEIGTGTSSSYNSPFNNYYKNSTNECLYLASEVGLAGTIDTIAYYVSSSANFSYNSLKIYMGTTSATSLSSGWVGFDQLQLVYSRENGTIGSQTGWESYPLDAPFDYDGESNLIVVVCRQSSSYTSSLRYRYSSNSGKCRYRQSDGTAVYGLIDNTTAGSSTDQRANIHISIISHPDTLRDYLSNVQLNAIPNSHFHFEQWSDRDTTNPRMLTITQDTMIMAQFAIDRFLVQGESADTLRGSVSGSGMIGYMDSTLLTANSNYGYHFVSWDDGNTTNPRVVVADTNKYYQALFGFDQFAVTVFSADSTMGSVGGADTVDYLSNVVLNASPYYGYHFVSWNDGDTNNPRTVTADSNKIFTAQFGYNRYSIIVVSADTLKGSVSGSAVQDYLTTVVISATANYGYHFAQWNDEDTNNPRMVVADSNKTYTAQFANNQYHVTCLSSDTTKGDVVGGGLVAYLSTATITAVPAYGYMFSQWSDGNTDNPRFVQVTCDTALTASFANAPYSISVASNDSLRGVVALSGSYLYGTTHTLTATPNYGYHFAQWNDGDTNNPRTFVLTGDTAFTAQFDYNQYTVTGNTADSVMGLVNGTATQNYLTNVTLSAVANYGYHFTQWNDGNTSNPRTVEVDSNITYTASFDYNQYTVTGNTADSVMGLVNGTSTQNYLTNVVLTAVPNYGYHFTQWNDGNTSNPRTVEVDSNVTYVASFDYNQYTITVASADSVMGLVAGDTTMNYLSTAVISATANYGYHFTQWNDGNTDNPRTVEVDSNITYTASFDYNQYTVSVTADDETMGTVTGAGSYNYNSTIQIEAAANEHYHFMSWSDGVVDNPRTVVVTSDSSFTAVFAIDTHSVTLTVNDASMGTVTGEGEYAYGQEVTVVATANDGYHFVQWSNGETVATYTFTITEDITLEAVFEANVGIREVTADDIKISVSQMSITVNGGDGQMLRIFDVNGRMMVNEKQVSGLSHRMPAAGVYLVKVGNYPAQKVVVVR